MEKLGEKLGGKAGERELEEERKQRRKEGGRGKLIYLSLNGAEKQPGKLN